MANVWFISDIHGGHNNICKYRPFESEEEHFNAIKENYHKVVTKRDKVFFLGDITFTQERLEDIGSWVGEQKVLVLGNHCFTEDTELLTASGWKLVGDINTDDDVATVNLAENTMFFLKPIRTVVNERSELFSIKGTWIDEMVSSGHNCVLDGRLQPVKNVVGEHLNKKFTLAARSNSAGITLSSDEIRLLTWVVMDGTIVRHSYKKTRVQFKLSKQRKINALENLLLNMGVNYTKKLCNKTGINKLQPYYIRIYGEDSRKIHGLLSNSKKLPTDWVNMSRQQVEVFLETLCQTDGVLESKKIRWTTTSKNDAEIVQLACIRNGFSMVISEYVNTSGFSNAKLQYKCYIDQSENVASKGKVKIEPTGIFGKTCGVTMKYGTVVCRRNGKVSVSGNCTEHVHISEIVKNFDSVHSLIKYKEFWLSHAPLHPQELRGKINLHGHVHGSTIPDRNYFNCCLENTNYSPISLQQIRDKIKEIAK